MFLEWGPDTRWLRGPVPFSIVLHLWLREPCFFFFHGAGHTLLERLVLDEVCISIFGESMHVPFFLFDFPSIFPIYPLLMMFHLRSDASLHSHLLTWVWRIPYAVVPFLHTRSRYRSLLAFLYDPDVSRSSHDFVPRG